MLHVYVDADACPVKKEIYRVAMRCGLHVTLVANQWMAVPGYDWLDLVLVKNELDAADDWIAEHAEAGDIVVTADIPLASRCLRAGARVLAPRGREFHEHTIGDALATRELLSTLRETGDVGGGPPPIAARDRSNFLQTMDRIIQSIRRGR